MVLIMDWVVTIIGAIGFLLAGKKIWWAWYVNIANQILWVVLAVATQQWGFLLGVPLYLSVFVKNAYDWTVGRNAEEETPTAPLIQYGVVTPNEAREATAPFRGDESASKYPSDFLICPTCGPHAIEIHPYISGVIRCTNCKEHLSFGYDYETLVTDAGERYFVDRNTRRNT